MKKIICIVTILCMNAPVFNGYPQNEKKEHYMLFQKALSAKGKNYQDLRDQLVREESSAPALKPQDSVSWETSLLYEIINVWKTDPRKCSIAQQTALGIAPVLHPERYPTGKAPADLCIKELSAMGPAIAPVVLEFMYKCTDIRTTTSFGVCIASLKSWKDQRMPRLLRMLSLDKSEISSYRIISMQTLLDLDPGACFNDLVKMYEDPAEKEEIKISSLKGIGRIKSSQGKHKLITIFCDESAPLSFRVAAAIGMGEIRDTTVLLPMTEVFHSSKERQLKEAIIDALGSSGLKEAEALLKQWREQKENNAYIKKIDLALWKLSLKR